MLPHKKEEKIITNVASDIEYLEEFIIFLKNIYQKIRIKIATMRNYCRILELFQM